MQNAMRRVVITGLGAITPLAVGVRPTWRRLIDGQSGIISIKERSKEFAALPSQVAGIVPPGSRRDGGWDPNEWLQPGDDRKMAMFAQYAMACAEEALTDAGWKPTSQEDLENTGVYIGSGIGSLDDVYKTSVNYDAGGYKKVSPLFVPRLLINLAAGHISMKYGFMELEHAKARKAHIYAEVKGYGLSSDAHHMTAPRADGNGPYLAMKRALKNAAIKPSEVGYVNAHATSTKLGDAAENCAIKSLLLGDEGLQHASQINVSSTKGAVGHLLGAAGAVEAIFTILAMQENVIPPTLNLEAPDESSIEFNCNYVPKTAQQHKVNVALSNSFGFGGTNASICFARYLK
ncbi:hypothetical protein AAFC00_004014 [Neodothiora populina]|uniref:beta-ketoacyl-[acyl-carrier-protein] synthase I n=1 Tax=Neodothiora populina TaxID=2781224 RepID=A0ABR3PIA0_9PEZI